MPTNRPLCLYSIFKRLKFKFNIPFYQLFRRFKHSNSSFHGNTEPLVCLVNLKASDQTNYPKLPAPPPPTPEQDISSLKIISLGCSFRSPRGTSLVSPSPESNTWRGKIQNESIPFDELPFLQFSGRHSGNEKQSKVKGSDGGRANIKIISRFSPRQKDEGEGGDIESGSLVSDPRGFPYVSPVEVFISANLPKDVNKDWNGFTVRKSSEKRMDDHKINTTVLKFQASNNRKQMETKRKVGLEAQSRNMSESFAVVKNSNDPCEDFRVSMLEMILEKEMFEDKELENLLHCFLSLNSRHYHPIIVQAFTDVWEMLFCKAY